MVAEAQPSPQPAPKLLHILASSSIFKIAADGSMLGTGPFRPAAGGDGHRVGLSVYRFDTAGA